jgi:hypothetical protein
MKGKEILERLVVDGRKIEKIYKHSVGGRKWTVNMWLG